MNYLNYRIKMKLLIDFFTVYKDKTRKSFFENMKENLITSKQLKTVEIDRTGILNLVLKKLWLFTMLLIQVQFYRKDSNLEI